MYYSIMIKGAGDLAGAAAFSFGTAFRERVLSPMEGSFRIASMDGVKQTIERAARWIGSPFYLCD